MSTKKKTKKRAPKPQINLVLWAVMRAHKWDSVSFMGIPMPTPQEGPHRWIPVFNTRAAAVKWHGEDKDIVELKSPVNHSAP